MDVSTNANGNPKTSLLEDVHGLSIDLIEPTCGMWQVRNSSIMPHLLSICRMPQLFLICCPYPHLIIKKTRGKNSLVNYN